MPGTFEDQKAEVTAATDALIANVKSPKDEGVAYTRFLNAEIKRVKEAYTKAGIKLPLGKGGRGTTSEKASPAYATAAE